MQKSDLLRVPDFTNSTPCYRSCLNSCMMTQFSPSFITWKKQKQRKSPIFNGPRRSHQNTSISELILLCSLPPSLQPDVSFFGSSCPGMAGIPIKSPDAAGRRESCCRLPQQIMVWLLQQCEAASPWWTVGTIMSRKAPRASDVLRSWDKRAILGSGR